MARFVIVLRIFLAFECCYSAYVYAENNDDTVDCVYHGDMCEIDSVRCLAECEGYLECSLPCEYMQYPALYRGRGDVEFWVNISNFEDYKKNVAITVLRFENETSTVVQDCCNLKPGEKCTLPAFGDFGYHLFAPLDDGGYCTKPIEGRVGYYPKWCDEDPDPPCLRYNSGVIDVKELSTEISLGRFGYDTDYCLFHVPNEYASRGKVTHDGLTKDVEGISIEGNTIRVDDFEAECILIEKEDSYNVSYHLLSSNNTKSGSTQCLFFRIAMYAPDWRPKPICVTVDDDAPRNWSTIVIAIVAAVVFTALLIVSVCVCTKYLKFFIPSYEDSVRDGIMGMIVEDDDKFFMNVDASEKAVGTKSNKEKLNSKEEKLIVRYVTMSANNMSSNDVLENVCAIVPTVSLKIEEECSGEQTVLDSNDGKPTVEKNIPQQEELVPTCIRPPIIDGYSRKDDPELSPSIRHDLEASMSPDRCGNNLSCAMYTTDENGNDTETFVISSEGATKKVAMLPKDDNFDYIAKSSQCLAVIHEHQRATSSSMEWACVDTVS